MGESKLRGHCAVVTNPDGAVVATATDFSGADAAGFSVESRQQDRVTQRVELAFAKNHLNSWLAAKVTGYDARLLWELAERAGYKKTVFPIGEEEESSGD